MSVVDFLSTRRGICEHPNEMRQHSAEEIREMFSDFNFMGAYLWSVQLLTTYVVVFTFVRSEKSLGSTYVVGTVMHLKLLESDINPTLQRGNERNIFGSAKASRLMLEGTKTAAS